jgi:hypothetical protein
MLSRVRAVSPAILITGIVLVSAGAFLINNVQSMTPLYLDTGVFDATIIIGLSAIFDINLNKEQQ